MVTRARLVQEVMKLCGTPFHHQGRSAQFGVDCIGCLILPILAVGLPIKDDLHYSRQPNPRQLLPKIQEQLDPVQSPEYGDVGICWCHPALAGLPHHGFWLVPGPPNAECMWMVHALVQNEKVVYTPFSSPWPEQVYGYFRVRGVE